MKGLVIALWLLFLVPWISIILNSCVAHFRNDDSSLPGDIAMALLPFAAGAMVILPAAVTLTIVWLVRG